MSQFVPHASADELSCNFSINANNLPYLVRKPNEMVRDLLLDRITTNPTICFGKPPIRNLRYPVHSLLQYLAAGDKIEDLLIVFPDLEKEDFQACIAYAVTVIQEGRSDEAKLG